MTKKKETDKQAFAKAILHLMKKKRADTPSPKEKPVPPKKHRPS